MDMQGDVDRAFGAEMAETRKRRGLSQRDLIERLAERGLRLDVPAISRIETGTRAVRLWEAITIVSVLDMSLDGLIPRTDLEEAMAMDVRARDEIAAGVDQIARSLGLALYAWDLLSQQRDLLLPPAREGGVRPTDRASYIAWIADLMERDFEGPYLGIRGRADDDVTEAVRAFFRAIGDMVTTAPKI